MQAAVPSLFVAVSLAFAGAPPGAAVAGVAPTDSRSADKPLHPPVEHKSWIRLNLGAAEAEPAHGGLPTGLLDALARDVGIGADSFLRQAEAAALATELLDDLGSHGIPHDAVEVDADGALVIGVEDAAQAAQVLRMAETVGAQAEQAPPPPAAPASPVKPRLRPMTSLPVAGSAFMTSAWIMCTLSFWGRDNAGQTVALTAGHCDRSGSLEASPMKGALPFLSRGGPAKAIGSFTKSHYGDGLDFAVILASRKKSVPPARIKKGEGGSSVPIRGVVAPIIGATVCKSGAATGWTCGKVIAAPREYELADDNAPRVNGFATSMCSAPGDSGAPVISGRNAVGILSFGSFHLVDGDSERACDVSAQVDRLLADLSPMEYSGGKAALREAIMEAPHGVVFTGVHPLLADQMPSVLGKLGSSFRISVHVPVAKITKAAARAKGGTTIKGKIGLEGAKAENHTVKVRIAGKTHTAKLSKNGKFEVKIPKLKVPRKYVVTVSAKLTHKANSSHLVATPAKTSGKTVGIKK